MDLIQFRQRPLEGRPGLLQVGQSLGLGGCLRIVVVVGVDLRTQGSLRAKRYPIDDAKSIQFGQVVWALQLEGMDSSSKKMRLDDTASLYE